MGALICQDGRLLESGEEVADEFNTLDQYAAGRI